jgi:hypothetical protein
MEEMDFDKHLVHAVKGEELEDLDEITVEVCAQLDDKWATYSVDFIKKMANSDKPFFSSPSEGERRVGPGIAR